MASATEITEFNLAHWPPNTRFYSADDNTWFVSIVGVTAVEGSRVNVRQQPTVILYTNDQAVATDLEVDFTFPPGTSHEDAVIGAGYTLAS